MSQKLVVASLSMPYQSFVEKDINIQPPQVLVGMHVAEYLTCNQCIWPEPFSNKRKYTHPQILKAFFHINAQYTHVKFSECLTSCTCSKKCKLK